MRLLHAMGIRVLRTYNTKLAHATTTLEAIRRLKNQNPDFEMYVMIGAWINCEGAFGGSPNHDAQDYPENKGEIERAIQMARDYPDIVKIIAVGNEAMVKWAASYFVQPDIILEWVNYLQEQKQQGELPADLWITSSDNFASWGGGDTIYHVPALEELIKAVDFVSLHTYPMHDTHYNPEFWGLERDELELSEKEKVKRAMLRSLQYAQKQYESTKAYVQSIDPSKDLHIGETGWASASNGFYGEAGSKATDEFKQALYYQYVRDWTNKAGISCFYFEAFDEIWKDAGNPGGSENHFGVFTLDGQAKCAIWNEVDEGIFDGLGRSGNEVRKTVEGDSTIMFQKVSLPETVF